MFGFLKGEGWAEAAFNNKARGIFLLDIRAAGERYCFATSPVETTENGRKLKFIPAVLSSPNYSQTVDPFQRDFNQVSMNFSIMGAYFPYLSFCAVGQSLLGISVDVYWFIDGCDFTFEQAVLVLHGNITKINFNEETNVVDFSVADDSIAGDRMFPPRYLTDGSFSTATPEESKGQIYPVVFGDVKKLPCFCTSADGLSFLVMDDPHGKFSSASPVTAMYDEDDPINLAASSQGVTQDLNGANYAYITIASAPASADVTADVTGNDPNIVAAIVFLLNTYSSKSDFFDLGSILRLKQKFSPLVLALSFNQTVDGGVINAIRNRLVQELPLFILQQGKKFHFHDLLWDSDCVKVLSTKQNIFSVISPPAPIDKSELISDYTITYGTSGLRGDSQGAISRNKDNDAMCLTAFNRYGDCGSMQFDASDIADVNGAGWLLNWHVLTRSVLRVRVSYRCTMDALDLNLWDTVRVYDHYNGWVVHLPLFKVVGLHYDEAPGIGVDLLSIEDFFDVYNVNRSDYNYLRLRYAYVYTDITAPRVSSASATSASNIRVIFNENIIDGSGTISIYRNANYTFSGVGQVASPIAVTGVVRAVDQKTVDIAVSGSMVVGVGNYTVTVDNVVDGAWNTINPAFKTANFNGVI